jgi:hypothetical protein
MRKRQKQVGRWISRRKIVSRYNMQQTINWCDIIQDTTQKESEHLALGQKMVGKRKQVTIEGRHIYDIIYKR